MAYDDLHVRVAVPHDAYQRRERCDDISDGLVLLYDVIRPEVHSDDICWVGLEPADKLLPIGDVDGQETRVTLVVAVVRSVSAVVLRLAGSDPVDRSPFGGL